MTFVLSDVSGSTRLWESSDDVAAFSKARNHWVASDFARRGPRSRSMVACIVLSRARGDCVVGAFARASDAVAAAVNSQRALADDGIPPNPPFCWRSEQ